MVAENVVTNVQGSPSSFGFQATKNWFSKGIEAPASENPKDVIKELDFQISGYATNLIGVDLSGDSPSIFSNVPVMHLSAVAIGIAFVVLGIYLDKKRQREEVEADRAKAVAADSKEKKDPQLSSPTSSNMLASAAVEAFQQLHQTPTNSVHGSASVSRTVTDLNSVSDSPAPAPQGNRITNAFWSFIGLLRLSPSASSNNNQTPAMLSQDPQGSESNTSS